MPCAGDSTEICGAGWELSVYKYNATLVSGATCSSTSTDPTTGANATTTATPTSTLSTTITSAPTATSTFPVYLDSLDSSEWYHLGCAIDSGEGRVFDYGGQYNNALTIDSCLIDCEDAGYTYAGMEYGIQCFCGNSVPSTVVYDDESACATPCGGNATEMCGGDYRLDVYLLSSTSEADCNATATSTFDSSNNIAVSTGTALTTTSTTATATAAVQTGSSTIPASSQVHSVYAHHMVGNTYPYGVSDWASDISAAQAAGIDGFALNMGSDYWQPARVADAYTAANAAGFKVFLSLDMT